MSTTTSTTMTPFSHRKDDKMKEISVLGFVSFAAVVHSHLYWVYSIIYIAYHKITPNDEMSPVIKWRSKKFKQNNDNTISTTLITSNKKKKVHRHSRKKSLTSKPKSVIMPTIAPTKVAMVTSGTTVDALLSSAPKQHRVPLLHALRTFPSSSPSAKQTHPFNIHQLIKSQRKTPKRSSSTGELNKATSSLPALIEVETRNSEDSFSSGSGTESLTQHYTSKKNRAFGLLRSTFHRSHSTDTVMMNRSSSSYSSLSEEENVIVIAAATAKKRKRDAIFGITRKFSGRRNNNTSDTQHFSSETAVAIESSAIEDIKKQQRMKLFRNLPSWKKEKHTTI